MRISGTVIEGEDGELVLSVARPEMVYLLRDHPDAIGKVAELEKAGTGKKVYVHGHMDGKTPSQKQTQSSLVLRLRTFLIKTVLLAGTCLKRNRLGQSSLLIGTLLSMTRVRLSHQSPNRRVAVRFNDTPGWLEKPRVETYLSGLEVRGYSYYPIIGLFCDGAPRLAYYMRGANSRLLARHSSPSPSAPGWGVELADDLETRFPHIPGPWGRAVER